MTALTFDTLKFANRLKAAGVPDKQAEAEAEALADVFEANWKELASREDLRLAKEDLRHEIELVRRDLKELENRLIIKVGAMIGAAVGIVAVLVKML